MNPGAVLGKEFRGDLSGTQVIKPVTPGTKPTRALRGKAVFGFPEPLAGQLARPKAVLFRQLGNVAERERRGRHDVLSDLVEQPFPVPFVSNSIQC